MTQNYKQIIAKYHTLPKELRSYLAGLEDIFEAGTTYDIWLSYLFIKIERFHRIVLKAGLLKIHKLHGPTADEAVFNDRLNTGDFPEKFERIFSGPLSGKLTKLRDKSAVTRNSMMHGKNWSDAEARAAITLAMDYLEALAGEVKQRLNHNPFDLRGIRPGTIKALNEETSYWVLKGMGFAIERPHRVK